MEIFDYNQQRQSPSPFPYFKHFPSFVLKIRHLKLANHLLHKCFQFNLNSLLSQRLLTQQIFPALNFQDALFLSEEYWCVHFPKSFLFDLALFQLYCAMKMPESLSLGLDSFLSPPRNNKSSANLDTIASLSLSDINQNDLMKMYSAPKQFESDNFSAKLSKISESNVLEPGDPQDRLAEMVLLQRWVHQAAHVYDLERSQWRENEGRIKKMEHNNRLKKDAARHLKAMGEYLQKKQKKWQQEIKSKRISYRKHLMVEVQKAKERTQSLIHEIKCLEDMLLQEQKLSQQLQKEIKQYNSAQKKKSRIDLGRHPYNAHQLYPYHFAYHPHQIHDLPGRSWESEAYSHMKRSPSFDQHQTPHFLSKNPSLNKANNPNTYFPAPTTNGQLIMQVLAANIQNVAGSQASMVGKQELQDHTRLSPQKNWQTPHNSHSKTVETKAVPSLSISQHLEEGQNALYSPTNALATPQFDPAGSGLGFGALHQKAEKISKLKSGEKPMSRFFPAGNIQQSKVRVDVDDSISEMSKWSIEKKKRDQIRESTIKIQMQQQDSKSGETSMISDPTNQNTPRLRSPTVQLKNNLLDKIQLQQVSCSTSEIFNKPLPAPPRLPPNSIKKLRKVTEQQSDLFDSSGAPRIQKREKQTKQESQTVSVRDMVLDKSQIGVSERYPIPTSTENPEGRNELNGLQTSKRKNSKKATEEDEDDDDFMQINLLAVSKISKEKQYSQAFKTISDEGNQIGDLKKPSMVHKSQNLLKNSTLENIEQQQQFADLETQKREAQVKRIRKSSGSRFSEIKEPNRQLSLELNRG